MGADRQLTVTRPMTTDKPTTALGMLGLLIAECDSAAELAPTATDRRVFRGLAAEAREIEKAVSADRDAALYGRRSDR